MNARQKTASIASIISERTTLQPEERRIDAKRGNVHRTPWKSVFRTFDQRHLKEAFDNFKLLYDARDFNDFQNALGEIRSVVNDDMFLYILYTAVLHRDDCRDVALPPIEEVVPHWFFAAETIHDAIQKSIHFPDQDHTIENMSTAETTELESRLAYYREDVAMNIHHWAWHVVYPPEWDEKATGKKKDRKGELFYYSHQQMIARYDNERLSNGMGRVTPLRNFQDQMIGYAPHMTSQVTGVHFAFRPHGLTLRDLPNVSIQDLDIWRLRLLEAIDHGFARHNNREKVELRNPEGIDILAALLEPSTDSINRAYYGEFHAEFHNLIAEVQDPDRRFKEHLGVVGVSQTSARDPVFYRLHKYVDDIFDRHKVTLEPYTREELSLEGITIESAEVKAKQTNLIETFMMEAHADISNAPFLRTNRKILIKYKHLAHEPFSYIFKVNNETRKRKEVTFRVFLGPKYDEFGNEFNLNVSRRLMIELDKFQMQINPGKTDVRRDSRQSSVILRRRTYSFTDLKEGNYENEPGYCACGWPDYLLIPKGSPRGTDFQLFVMCTDYTKDKPTPWPGTPPSNACTGAESYCGSKDQKYPDTKPMGFPFDRRINVQSGSTDDFFTSNMILTDIKIRFRE